MATLKEVLIIDDDRVSATLLTYLIEDLDEKVEQVVVQKDGLQALGYLRKQQEASLAFPDLILLDIRMPKMSGKMFVQEYEKNFAGTHSRLVILTNAITEEDKHQILKYPSVLGCYLKPLTVEDLQKIVTDIK